MTVLITGGTRGIGRATAIEFAKKGYDIVINYVKEDGLALELKEEIEKEYGEKVYLYKADISNEVEVEEMRKYIVNNNVKIDVLVNNASIAMDSFFFDKTVRDFKRVLDVNLIGTFLVSKYFGETMLAEKQGCIINVSSTNGIDTGYPESIDYDASKAGVISLTKNLAKELAPYIRVNSVAPGWVNTDMNKNLDEEFIQKENKKIILNRFAEPDEIAKVIVFLASPEASYINGETIRVDGGQN